MYPKHQLVIHSAPELGRSVIYVMSRDQRVADNLALSVAQSKAVELGLPLVVLFNLHSSIGVRAYEHAEFMLKGLESVAEKLDKLNIPFVLTADDTDYTFEKSLKDLDPAVIYFDFSPLHGPREKIKTLAKKLQKSIVVIDTHNIIPVWFASSQQEFAAYTFRHKIHKNLQNFLIEPEQTTEHPHKIDSLPASLGFDGAYEFINKYPKRGLVFSFKPGESAARNHLSTFISEGLSAYAAGRNNLAIDQQSGLSPYLHFGQISSLRVALDVLYNAGQDPLLFYEARLAQPSESPSHTDGMNALFEEMIVRKELSDNFCFYAKNYKNFDSIPEWAITTLNQHEGDKREYVYTLEELEGARTHDESWNAAQSELVRSGKMHGYMRMYWAKKILEWTENPKIALEYAIYLNDAYSIDGGDPNGYVGVLWAVAGLHDRPWTERPVFGKIRYMNEAGLRRKFDMNAYIKRVS